MEKIMNKGIITGDVVKSTSIPIEDRALLLDALTSALNSIQSSYALRYEIFRGDSVQLIVDHPSEALLVALLLRSGIKGETPAGTKTPWDIRLSIGIGHVEFIGESLGVSDGEAFRLSGRGLDMIGKDRLCVITPWEDINDELSASIPYVDSLVTNWTVSQSKVVFAALKEDKTIMDIGAALGQSHQNVSKQLIAAKVGLIKNSLARFSRIINAKIQ